MIINIEFIAEKLWTKSLRFYRKTFFNIYANLKIFQSIKHEPTTIF